MIAGDGFDGQVSAGDITSLLERPTVNRPRMEQPVTDHLTPTRDEPHQAWLRRDALRQLDFFRPSLRGDGGFDVLDWSCAALPDAPQELHTTTRMVHSFALGHAFGAADCEPMIDAGMAFLWGKHRDQTHGGYVWSVDRGTAGDRTKLAYGHVFTLLAGASAKQAGHGDADRLIADVSQVLDDRFWDNDRGLLREEFNADWTPFSTYRGMNANMHGTEAMLAAYEATDDTEYLARAGRILTFFIDQIAAQNEWRIIEHFDENWTPDPAYRGDPMFRPTGTTPGHSLELARLLLQHWDLSGRPDTGALGKARALIYGAFSDAWLPDGGIAYTLDDDGAVAVGDRYWWPVAEAIGAISVLNELDPTDQNTEWYDRLWQFAQRHFVDETRGGWYPEIDAKGAPTARQFHGKPDIYHSLQAALLPLAGGASGMFDRLAQKRDR